MVTRPLVSEAPYPGLRSFQKHEVDIFFGRDDHVDEMIGRLAASHFLCITGPSGCGKSSLARTGLMNSLEAGFLPGRGSDWIFADMRPGGAPLKNLFGAIAKALAGDAEPDAGADARAALAARADEIVRILDNHVAGRSSNLAEALAIVKDAARRPMLILVDQFEELFRYEQNAHAAVKFVDVLLRTVAAKSNIYVTITIRTDQLEKCSKYPGLTAAINDSQFLTPSLDRFQIEEAIEGPIAVFGGRVHPELTLWLLNSIEDEFDKLPLLQHAMKLLYRQKGGTGEIGDHGAVTITLGDFFSLFGFGTDLDPSDPQTRALLGKSLSNRLDAIYDALPERLKRGAVQIFCALTGTETGQRDIRRPLPMRELVAITGLSAEETQQIINAFSNGADAYLQVKEGGTGPGEAIVDVTHECVLRLWDRLQEWLSAEQTNARNIRFLAELATTHDEGLRTSPILARLWGDNLLTSEQLRRYGRWFDATGPTATWAVRYLKDFGGPQRSAPDANDGEAQKAAFRKIETLLLASRNRQQLIKRSSIAGGVVVAVIAVVASAYYVTTKEKQVQTLQQDNARLGLDANIYQVTDKDRAEQDCDDPRSFCSRLRQAKFRRPSAEEISRALATSICPVTAYDNRISSLARTADTFCGKLPDLASAPVAFASLGADSRAIVGAAGELTEVRTYSPARVLLYPVIYQSPNTITPIRFLARAYFNDALIPDARGFEAGGACVVRAVSLACRDADDNSNLGYNLDQSALDLAAFFLRHDLNDDILVLAQLSVSMLGGADIEAQGAQPPHSKRLISGLWRAGEASAEAARLVTKRYGCAKSMGDTAAGSPAAAEDQACALVRVMYRRAALAWSRVVQISAALDLKDDEREQIAFGVGAAALYWGQDPEFRKIAKELIDLGRMTDELRKAAELRKTPRYFIGLGMIYCLQGRDIGAIKHAAQGIQSHVKRYEDVKKKIEGCGASTDIESYFTNDTITK
jgi:hypothetical protein